MKSSPTNLKSALRRRIALLEKQLFDMTSSRTVLEKKLEAATNEEGRLRSRVSSLLLKTADLEKLVEQLQKAASERQYICSHVVETPTGSGGLSTSGRGFVRVLGQWRAYDSAIDAQTLDLLMVIERQQNELRTGIKS